MSAIDWTIVFVLNGAVIAYGFYLSRGTTTSSEWFLGSRSLPWWAIGLSMFATNVDNADLVSKTSLVYTEGMHITTVHTFGSMIGTILAAFWVVPTIYRAGFFTNAEYLEARFGPAMRVLSALIQIQYRSIILGLMIWAVYLLLTGLVGMAPVAAWLLVVVVVILAAWYTAWGGLRSVAWTDALQGLVMMAGAAAIVSAVWQEVGGWSVMVEKLESVDVASTAIAPLKGVAHPGDLPHIGRYHGADGRTSPLIVVLGWTIIASGYWTVNHTQTMRMMGSRSLWDMKMAAIFGTMISIPIMIASGTLGLYARVLEPNFADPDQLYPFLAGKFLGVGMKGLVVAGIVAAAVSTFDSMGSALSAVFTRDVYARLFVRDAQDRHYVRVSRCATVVILALGFAYIPFIEAKDTMLDAFLTLIPVFVTPLFTLYLMGVFTRAHRRSGVTGLLVGAAYGLIALYDREAHDLAWLAPWFTGRWAALCWSMLFTAAGAALATLFCGSQDLVDVQDFDEHGWLQRSREDLPRLREHPFRRPLSALLRPDAWAAAMLLVTAYIVFVLFW